MLRSGFIFVLHLVLVFKVCNLVDSTISKPFPRCRPYKVHAYNKSGSSCGTPVGGNQNITIENFPHIVILIYRDVKHRGYASEFVWACHGTLVSSRYVLTSVPCLGGPTLILSKVRFGAMTDNFDEPNSFDIDVESTIWHPLHNQQRPYKSIALIKLAQKVEFSTNIRPICLPDRELISSSKLYQVSYAFTSAEIIWPLKKYEITLFSNEECNANYTKPGWLGFNGDVLCLRGTTFGDFSTGRESGAPIYIDQQVVFINDVIHVACSHVLLGITAFGYERRGYPDGATKVYRFLEWIENIIWADGEDI